MLQVEEDVVVEGEEAEEDVVEGLLVVEGLPVEVMVGGWGPRGQG